MKVQAVFWIADGLPYCQVDTQSPIKVRDWYRTLVKVFPESLPVLMEIELREPFAKELIPNYKPDDERDDE